MLYERGDFVRIRLHPGNSAAVSPVEITAEVLDFIGPHDGLPAREYYMGARVEVAPEYFEEWEGWIEQKDMLEKVEDPDAF